VVGLPHGNDRITIQRIFPRWFDDLGHLTD
jgi:hypothetical protein